MKAICFFIAALLLAGSACAQHLSISGTVTDNDQKIIGGAVLTIAENGHTAVSDSFGRFTIPVSTTDLVRFSAKKNGYSPLSMQAKAGDAFIHVVLIKSGEKDLLQEVIVTDNHVQVRKENESLNLEIVNREFIQRHLGGSLMKTLERLPGIKTIGIGSGQSKPLIRGLGFNRVVVIDKGLKHEGQQWGADHGLELDQFAAAEVELIKGSASFIYGSDAIGGVIEVKPAAIPLKNSSGGSIELIGKSNNGLYGSSANLFGRKKKLFVNARLTYQNYGDYRVPADKVQVYNYQVDLYRKMLRNTAGRESAMHFDAGYVDENFQSVFYISNLFSKSGFFANAHGLEPRQVNTGLHDASERDIQLPGQEVNHFKIVNKSSLQKASHRFSFEVGYQRNFRQEFSQYVNHGYMPPVYPDTMKIPADLERQFDKQVYSASLRDELTLGNHLLTIGFNSEHQSNTINGWTFLVPSFRQTTAGAFAYDKLRLTDHLLLHSALRVDHGSMRLFRYTDWFASNVASVNGAKPEKAVRAEDLRRTFQSLVWSLGLNYTREHFSAKVNVGKSFRMPIAKELGANGVNYHYFSYERGDPGLSAEQSYQGDLGFGYTGKAWSVQFSPFINFFPNYIYLNPTADHDIYYGAGNQVFQYAQSKVLRYGGEMQVKARVAKSFSTEILGEYLYSRQLSGDKKGYSLPFAPPPSLLLNATWSPASGKRLTAPYISIDYRITASQGNIVPPEKKTPGYQVINLQAGFEWKLKKQRFLFSAQVQNLFNTRYLNHTSFYRLIELPEAGRNIIVSLRLPFLFTRINEK